MPRKFNKKCAACAGLAINRAREQSCWNESSCPNRRNYYRSRDRKLKSKKQSYAIATGKPLPTQFEIVPDTYRAELILYGRRPNKLAVVKGGVKGFQVLIYQGSNLVSQSNMVSCAGMIQSELEEAIDGALGQIGELYGIKTWGEILWKNPLKKLLKKN